MAKIDLHGLAHSYERAQLSTPERFALKDIELTFENGGAYALLGPSGCGKTTLLGVMSGLLRPTLGRVSFDDVDVTERSPEERNIAQVFQFPVVYDTMTVAENLAFPLRNRRVAEAEIERKVYEVAGMLDLTSSLGHKAGRLGVDEKQKLSMGRGLVRQDVAAILLDEPLTRVDPSIKSQLRRELKQVHAALGHTIVYVTHDQNEALTFAQKVVVMLDGEVVQVGTPRELFEKPEHRFVGYFIGSPGMNFFPCKLVGNGLVIEGTGVELGGRWFRLAQARAGARLELGIRPEFLEVVHEEGGESVPVQVLEVDDLGSHRLVTVGLGPHAVMVKMAKGKEIPADLAQMRFDPTTCRLFADGRLVI